MFLALFYQCAILVFVTDVSWSIPYTYGLLNPLRISSRWDFIQGESALYRRIAGSNKPQEYSGFRRRIQKKMLATKQKLEELDTVATGLSHVSQVYTVCCPDYLFKFTLLPISVWTLVYAVIYNYMLIV